MNDKREEFIRAAGFRAGWENLESWARTMVDHALDREKEMAETCQEMEKKIAILSEALRWYEEKVRHGKETTMRGDTAWIALDKDNGSVARIALGEDHEH